MKTLVTGGAGFIGSHLVDALIAQQNDVTVIDDLSSGQKENLRKVTGKDSFKFVEGDLKTPREWDRILNDTSIVYHFAANPEVRAGETRPEVHFNENLVATFNLLEAMRKSRAAKTIIFASTSTVYGEPSTLPTPEEYGPLLPISTYGASKLGCEALICSYANTFQLRGLILRLGNIVGSRAQHGIIMDLIKKLRSDPSQLEILGDGTQKKSYVHISDCVDGTLFSGTKFLSSESRIEVYNVSSPDQVGVKRIAEIVIEEMGLSGVIMNFTGGVDGGRGWPGDVKFMHLSIDKLQKLGWSPTRNSEEAVRLAAHELASNSAN